MGVLNLMETFFYQMRDYFGDQSKIEKCSVLELEHYFNMTFIFSYTWGIGGGLVND